MRIADKIMDWCWGEGRWDRDYIAHNWWKKQVKKYKKDLKWWKKNYLKIWEENS